MRSFKRYARAGFTLVELMIVVAIIGILAALAIYGVRQYLQSAKTSECKNSIGAISRGATGAFERENTPQELLSLGQVSASFSHDVCGGAENVPSTMASITGTKYQPNPADGEDFESGDTISGWKCLKFTLTSPIYYSYGYMGQRRDSATGTGGAATNSGPALQGVPAADGDVLIFANGNLDGDTAYSSFGMRGSVDPATQSMRMATELEVVDEYE